MRWLERGSFSAEEADDFYFTMRLGELPHSTCLSCWTGSQRDCLLAAFDSNKKMILIRKGEDIVARACIRLTKGAFQRPADFDFSFADLAQEQPADKMGAGDEMLILFLEYIYTSGLNDEEAETTMKMAVSLVTQKAAAIGAVAVAMTAISMSAANSMCISPSPRMDSSIWILWEAPRKLPTKSNIRGLFSS